MELSGQCLSTEDIELIRTGNNNSGDSNNGTLGNTANTYLNGSVASFSIDSDHLNNEKSYKS